MTDQSYTLIVKRKSTNDTNINKLRDFSKFNLINLTEQLTADKFLEKIDSLKKDATEITNQIFIDTCGIGEAILYVYYLLGYEHELFSGKSVTTIEKQLLKYAKKLMIFIETGIDGDNDDNVIHKAVESYCSLFKIWNSKDQLNDIDKYYSMFLDALSVYKYNKTKHSLNGKVKDTLVQLMDSMLDTDFFESFKLFLCSYSKIKVSRSLARHFWKNVYSFNDKDLLMYPLIVELSKLLIASCTDDIERSRLSTVLSTNSIADKLRVASSSALESLYSVCRDQVVKNGDRVNPSTDTFFNKFVELYKIAVSKTI